MPSDNLTALQCVQIGDVIYCRCGNPSAHYGTMGERGARVVKCEPPPAPVTSKNDLARRIRASIAGINEINNRPHRAGLGVATIASFPIELAEEAAAALEGSPVETKAECPHCREVYEIWANTEGFAPVTAPESYLQRAMEQMRDAAAKGLSPKSVAEPST